MTLIRDEIETKALLEEEVSLNPFDQFRIWFEDAKKLPLIHPEAMVLATVTASGTPSARVVLLKQITEQGFVFFTNYESNKGKQLQANPSAEVVFWWEPLGKQIRISGTVEALSREDSQGYFHSRHRGSKIGAWASRQSRELENREVLEQRVKQLEEEYQNEEIPCPEHWGGFCLRPSRFEFWQNREFRLHDRLVFSLDEKQEWHIVRLYP